MNKKSKIVLSIFAWITIIMIVESPAFGLNIYSTSTQAATSIQGLHNGFIGSNYISYSSTVAQVNNGCVRVDVLSEI